MAKKYAVINAISSFNIRYVAEMDDDETDPTPYSDYVVCDQIEEFTQFHIGEQVIDTEMMTKEEVLALFDRDHIRDTSPIFNDWADEIKLRAVMKKSERPK